IVPFAEAFRLLAAIEGAVDLDPGHGRAHMFELAPLRQLVGIIGAAPGLKSPAAHTDMDFSGRHRRTPCKIGSRLTRRSFRNSPEIPPVVPLWRRKAKSGSAFRAGPTGAGGGNSTPM